MRMQRWRYFAAHLSAYVLVNAAFLAIWAMGREYFWPAWVLIGWGVGLSSQPFSAVVRNPIHGGRVRARMQH